MLKLLEKLKGPKSIYRLWSRCALCTHYSFGPSVIQVRDFSKIHIRSHLGCVVPVPLGVQGLGAGVRAG